MVGQRASEGWIESSFNVAMSINRCPNLQCQSCQSNKSHGPCSISQQTECHQDCLPLVHISCCGTLVSHPSRPSSAFGAFVPGGHGQCPKLCTIPIEDNFTTLSDELPGPIGQLWLQAVNATNIAMIQFQHGEPKSVWLLSQPIKCTASNTVSSPPSIQRCLVCIQLQVGLLQ